MAEAARQGWRAVRWESKVRWNHLNGETHIPETRDNAALQMSPPDQKNSRHTRRAARKVLQDAFFAELGEICSDGCCRGWVGHREKPWTPELEEAFDKIEAELGERPTAR